MPPHNQVIRKMPFKPPEAPRCPVCNQMVYAAEAKMAGGFTYHKVCFKCCKYAADKSYRCEVA